MAAIMPPCFSRRRLAGSLCWSIACACSPLARDAEVRALSRRVVGPYAGVTGPVLGTTRSRKQITAALTIWRWPTLPGLHRALALAMAERQIHPRLAPLAALALAVLGGAQ